MVWQQFIMDLGSNDPEFIEALLLGHGASAVTLSDAGDLPVLEPAPGETPLWKETRVTALFAAEADLTALIEDLTPYLEGIDPPGYRIEPLEDRVWEREWLNYSAPMQFGERLWVCPGDSSAPDGAVLVRLDPGLAFGTGTHPTTALCLEWLESIDIEGKTVLDFGCGSGLLAIAALKLGAASATGIDIDPQAIVATRQNAMRNGVADRLAVVLEEKDIHGQFDIVVANILAGPLVDLAEFVITRLSSGGELALSGILSGQVDKIRAAYEPRIDFDVPALRSQGNQTWARLSGKRRPG